MLIAVCLMGPFVCGAQGQQSHPAWYIHPQFFAEDYSYDFPNSPPLSSLPVTGQIFGAYILTNTVSDLDVAREVSSWHYQGGQYFFVEDLYARNDGSTPADWDSFRMRNLNGAYINLGGFYASQSTPLYSLSSPVFQQALLSAAMHAVDLGGDGITFDDSTGQLDIILGSADSAALPDQAGSFDSVTMAAFQAYLQQNFTASQLMSQFGISNISSFNYANYIQANNLTETWNQQPLTGLARQFYLFKRQEELNFLRTMISTTKQYAQQKYGRDFLFAFNGNDYPGAYFLNDVMDFEYDESPYIRGGDHPFRGVDTKAWKGWKSPNVVYPSAMAASWGTSAAPYLSGPTVNLERVLNADIYAAGGIRVCSIEENLSDGTPEPVDLSVVNLYATFVLNNPQLMTQTTTNAPTLLIQSASSLFATLAAPAEATPGIGYTDYIGTGRLMLDSGFSYDSLFVPDTSYSQLPPLTLAALTPYKVVIAPYSWALDDNQVSVLLAYAQQGGTLVIDGHFANTEPNGTPAARPNLQTILVTQGAQPYGSGTIVVTNVQYGVEYESAQFQTNAIGTQANIQAAFVSFLAPYVSPTVVVAQPVPQIHQPGVGAFFYRDVSGHALVHLVNYDYDDRTDQFITKTNIQVQVQVGTQAVNAVVLRSPDMAGAQSLSFTQYGGAITVTVPEIYAWGVLYFETSTNAPVVNSASPATAIGAVGGNSLTLSVQASDADGNPLTYTWMVNGQVVTGAVAPSYTLQLPVTAAGVYIVTVSITDGVRVTQNSWTINVRASGLPTVLFDQTHSESLSINPAQGSPSWASLAMLAQAMQPLYQARPLAAGPITAQALSGAAVLVLPAPNTPLTASEIQAIGNFVQGGGGLLLADGGTNNPSSVTTSMNALIGPLGLTLNETPLLAPFSGNSFLAATFAVSPAIPPDPSFVTFGPGSILVSSPAVSLAQSDVTVWKSVSGQPTQQPGDPNGPFTLIAGAQFGKGRVYIVEAAFAFDDAALCSGCSPANADIFLSALAWLSAPSNLSPPAPGPPNLSITKTHAGNFSQGQQGAVYTLTVANVAGAATTSGVVTVTETVPSSLTLASMAGAGWTCPPGGITCTRGDALAGDSAYPPITVTVNVAADAPPWVSNSVMVSGAGLAAATATDLTAIEAVVIGPQISSGGIANAATSQSGGVAPNEFISLKGSGLGPATGVASGMTTQLAGTSVSIGGTPAYLTYAQNAQINVLVPFDVSGLQNTTVQVTYNGTAGNSVTVPVVPSSPGIFTQQYGPGQVWMVNQDGEFNSSSNPAARNSYVTFWMTGQGAVNTPVADGKQPSGPPYPTPILPVSVSLGGVTVRRRTSFSTA